MADIKLYLRPYFEGPDRGEGGIRRIVEQQRALLPRYGVRLVDDADKADLVACHAGDVVDTVKPLVCHNHGLYNTAQQAWSRFEWGLNRNVIELLRRADLVTVPSRWVAEQVGRGMSIDARVWYAGVDPLLWTPGESDGYVLWNKSRVDPICDPAPMLELAKRNPRLRFVSTFGTQLPNLTLTGRLPFERMRELVQRAGVYLVTSRETFGIGTLEAMACGVPVLAYAYGGQLDIVEHGVHGYLAKPGDLDDLQRGLEYCLANRTQLGEAARDRALGFTFERMIEESAGFYREVVKGRKRRPVRTSVIVTCYKLEEYLGDCLQSLQAQTDPDWECIVVDDCSPVDEQRNCAELVSEYAEGDRRIRYLRTPRNLYLAGARNYGIERAKGRYLLPLDADDMLAPRALEVLADYLDRQAGVAVAYGGMEVLEPDGRRWTSPWPGPFDWRRQMSHRNQLPYASLYRRSVWERTGGYRERCVTAEDADFWCRVTSFGARAVKATDYPCLIKRERPDSMGHTVPDYDWTAWYGWTRNLAAVPFGAAGEPPNRLSWPVKTYQEPRVSVIIPVGPGHGRLVRDALDSLLAQTCDAWEAIVVNDGGQPDLRGFPWARLLTTEKPGSGPAAARNRGIAAARAPYFLCLDADDYLLPTAIADLLGAVGAHGGYAYCDWYRVDAEGQHVRHEAPDWSAADLLYKGLPFAVTALVPKVAWEEAGGFDETIDNWEDWDFFFNLLTRGYCGTHVARPLFVYRFWSGQRREDGYASKEENAKGLRAKWAEYIEDGGRKFVMGCKSCSKGGGARVATSSLDQAVTAEAAAKAAAAGGAVLMEYVGATTGTRSYKGQKSGTLYRFGQDAGHRRKFVYAADVPGLAALPELRVVSQEAAAEVTPPAVRQGVRVGD